jgi:hypothetical protein
MLIVFLQCNIEKSVQIKDLIYHLPNQFTFVKLFD